MNCTKWIRNNMQSTTNLNIFKRTIFDPVLANCMASKATIVIADRSRLIVSNTLITAKNIIVNINFKKRNLYKLHMDQFHTYFEGS